ncbi:MAG: SWIM zinc finger family protein, partial [Planctomycetota bacterium]
MLVLPSWSPFFQSSVRMEGRASQLAGNVQRLAPDEDNDVLLRAEVKDQDAVHTVEISRDGRYAVAECTCDDFAAGSFCKHIWAALLDLDAHEDDEGHVGATINDLAKLRLRAPKAKKREEGVRPVRAAEPAWVGRLSLLRPTSAEQEADGPIDGATIFPTQRQVCYVVMPELSNRHHGLVVDLQQRTAIASGWSKPKPLRVGLDTIDQLADRVDRELV